MANMFYALPLQSSYMRLQSRPESAILELLAIGKVEPAREGVVELLVVDLSVRVVGSVAHWLPQLAFGVS